MPAKHGLHLLDGLAQGLDPKLAFDDLEDRSLSEAEADLLAGFRWHNEAPVHLALAPG